MKKKDRVVPKKNYLYLLIMIVLVVIITLSIFNINNKYQERKLEQSYFDGYLNEIAIEELNTILTEPNSEQFILITKTEDEEVYDFEVNLKKIIKKKDLRDNFIYINYGEEENLDELNKVLETKLKKLPAIVYLKNGELMKAIDSTENILQASEFDKLLEEYEVE